jgi:hypothetical protein
MAQQLSKTGITTTQTVEAWHVTQSVDALTAANAYDIDISGSLGVTGPLDVVGDITSTGRVYLGNIGTAITPQILGYVPANGRLYYFNTSSLSAQSASYALFAVTASYVATASWANNAVTASFVTLAQSASFVATASWANNAVTASFIATASWANNAVTASFVTLAQSASFVATASWAQSSSRAISSSYALTASYVADAIKTVSAGTTLYNGDVINFTEFDGTIQTHTVTYVASSSLAISSSYALTASYALNGGGGGSTNVSAYLSSSITGSTSASWAGTASYALTASYTPNIYNTDGVLTGNRQLDLDGNTLTIDARSGDVTITSSPSYAVMIADIPYQSSPFIVFYDSGSGQLTYNATSSFTSSWASRAVTSSFATTASFVVTASYVNTAYLSAYSLDTQNITVGATGQAITYDNIDFSQGISITGGSNIRVATAGKYNIQFSLQVEEAASSITDVWIWLKKNSTDIPASNTQYSWRSRGVAAWNFFVDASSSDLFQIYIATNTSNVSLVTDAAPFAGPVIPSVILTVNKIG